MLAKNDDKLLATYAEAIAGIERGDFHAAARAQALPELPVLFHVRRLTRADFHFFRGCIAFLMRAIPAQQGKAMSKPIIFIQVHGTSRTSSKRRFPRRRPWASFTMLLAGRAIEIVAETFIFIDEAEQPDSRPAP